jgi:hypothetical protein
MMQIRRIIRQMIEVMKNARIPQEYVAWHSHGRTSAARGRLYLGFSFGVSSDFRLEEPLNILLRIFFSLKKL